MTRPRPIYEGDTLMLTRRTRQRTFLLRPSDRVNEILVYMLAIFSQDYSLLVHAITFLSNHYHMVATDPRAQVTNFTRDFHSFVARHINAIHGEFENLWACSQTSLLSLKQAVDIVDKIAYTMANPVLSYLVEEGEDWPGVRRAWPAKPLKVKRPEGFLDIASPLRDWPKEVTLEMARPPGFEPMTDEELAEHLAVHIAAKEALGRSKAAAKGISFLGRDAILRQSRHDTPDSREKRFGISPRIGCKNRWLRLEWIERGRTWVKEHEDCYRRWRRGERDVVFPYGTNKMRVCYGVAVAKPPSCSPAAAPPG